MQEELEMWPSSMSATGLAAAFDRSQEVSHMAARRRGRVQFDVRLGQVFGDTALARTRTLCGWPCPCLAG